MTAPHRSRPALSGVGGMDDGRVTAQGHPQVVIPARTARRIAS